MEELAESGFKYNADEVLYITKNYEGKLMWLETGNNKSGMQHIMVRHKTDFANKGVTDIQGYLDKALKSKPIEKGMNESGPYAKYLLDGDRYTVAYGSNGYIVSFYPDKMK